MALCRDGLYDYCAGNGYPMLSVAGRTNSSSNSGYLIYGFV